MYSRQEQIKNRMLNRLTDQISKIEGSLSSTLLAAAAVEFENMNLAIDLATQMAFADTAEDEWLDRKVSEVGITRKPATYASGTVKIYGSKGASVKTGDLVASNEMNYIIQADKVIGDAGIVEVDVIAELSGSQGNTGVGVINIFPIRVNGLTSVTNEEPFTNGYDEETDEELRQRYFERVKTPPTSGNKYHYLNWAKEVTGVGNAKVYPLWNGPGTVKVVITDSNGTGAEQVLIDEVKAHIEENRPIGATVTVVSAVELPINISATLSIASNYILLDTVTKIKNSIIEYLKSIAFIQVPVSYAKIGALIIGTEGVLDYSNLRINGGTANINVLENQVVVLGTINLS